MRSNDDEVNCNSCVADIAAREKSPENYHNFDSSSLGVGRCATWPCWVTLAVNMEADRKGEHVRIKRDYQKGTTSYFDELGDSKVDYLLDEVWLPYNLIDCWTFVIEICALSCLCMQKWKLLPVIYKQRGLLLQHINSFNNFINVEIQKIVAANDEIRSTTNPHVRVYKWAYSPFQMLGLW